jgi:protein phosphatase
MGSRAVVIVCRDPNAARRRFGVETGDGEYGVCYTRTGRRFFDDHAMERALLGKVRDAMDAAGLWEELETEWVCLDCELMPWSAKAQALLRDQYASVGSAATAALRDAISVLDEAISRGAGVEALREKFSARAGSVAKYVRSYRQYCWPVQSVDDLRLAPFHLLASEGRVHTDKNHLWHMETLARLAPGDSGVLVRTAYKVIDLSDATDEAAGIAWWEEMTSRGGEGMVVKPLEFLPGKGAGRTDRVQPAIKCRGPEYLRIIYGPEYDHAEHLERLRSRGLAHKRSLAAREFALGVEALERFVRREPLRRVHECVFGVLALESEPVDPRL